MNIGIIIVAAGSGSRMGGQIPKQFIPINKKPILYHTLKAFAMALPQAFYVIVCASEYATLTQEIAQQFNINFKIVTGGNTRAQSVQNGLLALQPTQYIGVHDAARCLLTPKLISTLLAKAQLLGNAVPAVPVTDSVREVLPTGKNIPINRNNLRSVQTPQFFKTDLLTTAYQQKNIDLFTDDASLVQNLNTPINLIDGDTKNIKITYPEDVFLAQHYLNQQ